MSLGADVVQHAWFSVPISKATPLRASADHTDYAWHKLLASRPGLDKVNFWQPGGSGRVDTTQPTPRRSGVFALYE